MAETIETMRAALIEACAMMLWGKGVRRHARNRPSLEECFTRSTAGVADFEQAVRRAALASQAGGAAAPPEGAEP